MRIRPINSTELNIEFTRRFLAMRAQLLSQAQIKMHTTNGSLHKYLFKITPLRHCEIGIAD